MRVAYLEVCGFRAFGTEAQRLDFDSQLAVIHADNSQGKTSLAESVEFLFTGATTRRLLLGGSPSEFEDALRNAHLSSSNPVYVEMGLVDGDGTTRVLRRELLSDYRGASDCRSRLTLDGSECQSVTDVGLPLSDPPLAAPVLLEHTLRYAVSSKPGERSDYFKALLEVADLDIVQAEVAALIAERDQAPRPHLLAKLSELASIDQFNEALDPIHHTTEVTTVEGALRDACHLAAPPRDSTVAATEPLPLAAQRVREALESRQLSVLPVRDLFSSSVSPPNLRSSLAGWSGSAEDASLEEAIEAFESVAADYTQRVAAVDASTAEVLPLLRVALQTNQVAAVGPDHPTGDCPLCLTPEGLTENRIEAIRGEIADQQNLDGASGRFYQGLQALVAAPQSVTRNCRLAIPAARYWAADARPSYLRAATQLGAEPGQLDRLLGDIDDLGVVLTSVDSLHGTVVSHARRLSHEVERMQPLAADEVCELLTELEAFRSDVDRFTTLQAQITTAAETFVEIVGPELDSGTHTAGWATVVDLTGQVHGIAEALVHHQRHSTATDRLRQAAKEISTASRRVLDQRLVSMGEEVGRWWDLLRPDELTVFDSITRKGTGKRYLDVTAALAPQAAATGVVRNALAVFSNSQLNALGLSAFLARCTLLGTPIVLLDDPVPGSDREHRSTFATNVVAALLDDDRQVIVTTHDSDLARHLHTSHQHLGVDEFKAVLSNPREGTQVLRSGDEFERLMLDASSQMHSPHTANRQAAGNSLRIAAERLAKHVIVAGRRRDGDTTAEVADYDNKNLRDLRPLATQYCALPNEPGQWTMLARLLNDADHDSLDPPFPSELKTCHSTLRHLKQQHTKKDPNFVRP